MHCCMHTTAVHAHGGLTLEWRPIWRKLVKLHVLRPREETAEKNERWQQQTAVVTNLPRPKSYIERTPVRLRLFTIQSTAHMSSETHRIFLSSSSRTKKNITLLPNAFVCAETGTGSSPARAAFCSLHPIELVGHSNRKNKRSSRQCCAAWRQVTVTSGFCDLGFNSRRPAHQGPYIGLDMREPMRRPR